MPAVASRDASDPACRNEIARADTARNQSAAGNQKIRYIRGDQKVPGTDSRLRPALQLYAGRAGENFR